MLVQNLIKGIVSPFLMRGGAKKVAKASSSMVASTSGTEIFLSLFILSIVNYLIRAFIFMIVVNALMPRIKEMHPQLASVRDVSYGESILFVILFSVVFQ